MKRNIIYISLLFALTILFSCRKETVDNLQFDVQTDATAYKVGQQITFNFTGNAQNIVFWSGEKGRIYANRNRSVEKGTLQTFQFTTVAGAGFQNNNLSVLISKDFDGIYAAADVAKATWMDVTSRAVLSPNAVTGVAGASTSSGAVNITDMGNADNAPVYFAFKYLSASNTLKPRQWTVSAFTATNTLADGTVNSVIGNLSNAGFKGVDIQNPTYTWAFAPNTTNPTSMVIAAGNAGDPVNEDWAISIPVQLNAVAFADYGVSVTSINTLSPPVNFNYTFTAAGTYKVTFYAFNENSTDTKGITKEIILTIVP